MKIVAEITPIALARPRVNTTNRGRYLPARCKKYMEELALLVRASYQGKPLEVPITVTLHFYKPIKPTARTFGDIDNLAKAVLDACNGILWQDDSLIIEMHCYKHKGAGKIEMEVSEYE